MTNNAPPPPSSSLIRQKGKRKRKTSCLTWIPPRNHLLRSRLLRLWLFTPISLQRQLITTSTIPRPCTRRHRRLPTHHTPRVRSTTTPLPPHLPYTHLPAAAALLLLILLIKPDPIRPRHAPQHQRQRQRPRHAHRARRHVKAQVVHGLLRVPGLGPWRRQRRHQRGVGAVHE